MKKCKTIINYEKLKKTSTEYRDLIKKASSTIIIMLN